MYSVTGKLMKINMLKNNTYKYFIRDSDNKTYEFFYFVKDASKPLQFDTSREISVTYNKQHSDKYGDSNIIVEVQHGNFVKDSHSIIDFLIHRVHLPKIFAEKITEIYKENTLEIVLKRTDDLKNIKHRGITRQLQTIQKFKLQNKDTDFYVELANLKINSRYHQIISKRMGTDIKYIRSNIYDLYLKCKMPFKDCDNIAMNLKYDKNNTGRLDSFIKMIYSSFNSKGMMYEVHETINKICFEHQIVTANIISKLIKLRHNNHDYYTTKKLIEREKEIEQICTKLVNQEPVTCVKIDEAGYVEFARFDSSQRDAIKMAFDNCISIITGAPGTGKSYIIAHIVDNLHADNCIYVMAPTGAAVERLRTAKINSSETKTLHSLVYVENMCINSNTNIDSYKPLRELYHRYDEFIFFIDEMSMVDMNLFYKFLKIISKIIDKVRIILLGDHYQLPSISAGNVLCDLINSNQIKYTTLLHTHRTKQKYKNIDENAKLVLNGEDLQPNGKAVELLYADTKKEVIEKLKEVIAKYHIRYENSCILIPTRKNGICVNALNPILQNIYNPSKSETINSFNVYDNFRVGDKIIQCKNNKNKDVYNGSILVIESIKYDEHKRPIEISCKYYDNETNIGVGKYR